MVLQHGPISLHTMLEGPWLHKTAFPIPVVCPLDEGQRSSPLQGHGSWLKCEVALSNVRGEPEFSVLAAGWFCEKSDWIRKVEDVIPMFFSKKKKTDFNWQPFWGGGFLPKWIVKWADFISFYSSRAGYHLVIGSRLYVRCKLVVVWRMANMCSFCFIIALYNFATLKNQLTYQCPSSWPVVITMKKKLAGTWIKNIGYLLVQSNGNKFASGQILKKTVEVVKGWILAGRAQKSSEPWPLLAISFLSWHLGNTITFQTATRTNSQGWVCRASTNNIWRIYNQYSLDNCGINLELLWMIKAYWEWAINTKETTHGQVYGKVFRYIRALYFFGQTSKSSSKVLFKLDFFPHGALCCCVRYSNIEYPDEIFKIYH